MSLFVCFDLAAIVGGLIGLAYCAGFKRGRRDARDAYLEALDWLREHRR